MTDRDHRAEALRTSPRRRCLANWACSIAAIGAMTLPMALHAATFRGLEMDAVADAPRVHGLNSTGDQVVGRLDPTGAQQQAAVWSEDEHDYTLVGPSTVGTRGTRAIAQETSSDGTIRRTFGYTRFSNQMNLPEETWIIVEDSTLMTTTTTIIPNYPTATDENFAIDISQDGHRVAEYDDGSGRVSYYYDPLTPGYINLPDMHAKAMSLDGSKVVGIDYSTPGIDQAVMWSASTGKTQTLGVLAGGTESQALGISASGLVVVGTSESASLVPPLMEAVRWHPDLGMRPLEPIAPGESRQSEALASSDANIIVGRYWNVGQGEYRAFIWTPMTGRQDLKAFLQETYDLYADVQDWTLYDASHISADGMVITGSGRNPDLVSQAWVVDLTDENVAEVAVRSVGAPMNWEVVLRCGDEEISEVFFGLIPPEPFAFDDSFDFADCTNPTTVGGQAAFDCVGSSGIASPVDSSSYVILPQEIDDSPIENVMEAAFYFGIIGNGGSGGNLLCEPGDPEVVIGDFSLDVSDGVVHPVMSPYSFGIGRTATGDYIPDRHFRILRDPEPGGTEVKIRPELSDVNGSQWMVSMESPNAYGRFSFGIIVPPGAATDVVSFGDCNEAIPGSFNPRECANGLTLGSDIDYTLVRTLGPDPGLTAFGMRPDALYVYLEGSLSGLGSLPQINTPNNSARLGKFSFDNYLSVNRGYVPTITNEGIENFDMAHGDVYDWADENGLDLSGDVMTLSGTWEPIPDTDSDGDFIEDVDDKCPYVVSTQADSGTLEQYSGLEVVIQANAPDDVGDECQCGEAQNNGMVVALDIDLLRDIMADPSLGSSMSVEAKSRCNSVGPVDSEIDPATQLPRDCRINDIFALLKARAGLPPLISAPLESPSCPDVTTM